MKKTMKERTCQTCRYFTLDSPISPCITCKDESEWYGKSTKKSTKTSINGVWVPTFSEVTIYTAVPESFSGRVIGISNGHLHLSSNYADYYIELVDIIVVRVTKK
jgi:hypothetical protein